MILRTCLLLFLILTGFGTISAQKLQKLVFNLYTDSLKKGFYNYINVDGQFSDSSWLPLDSTQVSLSASGGFFKGNDLFIDSSFAVDSVIVHAVDRKKLLAPQSVVIYIRKRGFDEPLPSENDILNKRKEPARKRNLSAHSRQVWRPLQPHSSF